MVDLANDWNENDSHTITKDEIAKRLDKSYMSIAINDDDFTIYFDDDDLFFGHTIVYDGNIENDKFYVDIAG